MKEYNCPICKSILVVQFGTHFRPLDPKAGVTLKCVNSECSAQEVFGFSQKDEKSAYETLMSKYVIRSER